MLYLLLQVHKELSPIFIRSSTSTLKLSK